jgi:RNA polymerase sigma-70 factor (ECF subfamily)
MNLPGWTDETPGKSPGGTPVFATTHWSVVLAAREGDESRASEAMETLCRAYWYPLYAFVRRQGRSPEEAQDLTQGFFAHLLARDFLRGLAKENGRFRAFLLAALKHFLSDQWDKARALKRGGGQTPLSLDAANAEARYQREPVDESSPDRLYERRWALTLLDQALARLRKEFTAEGKAGLFETLRSFQGDEPAPSTAAEAAAQAGMPVNTFKSHLLRFRRRYRELLCEEVAQTVATPADVADELRHLKIVLSA